ncbi:MAG TPA: hypothetical protein VE553_06090 [Candidatus Binatia bacterium]|nr:hypothetical protein [Candidatus Binatia bacterium]
MNLCRLSATAARRLLLLALIAMMLSGCQLPVAVVAALPTVALSALTPTPTITVIPPTWTPAPQITTSPTAVPPTRQREPTATPLPIPTNTPITPSPTPTETPTITPTPSVTPDVRPLNAYGADEVIPVEAFPRPPGDNGWGIHWIPTVKQDPGVVDRFVSEVMRMHIKWVVFLNDGTNIGDNDYLVDRLVAQGIMPVMRVYRSTITPHDGDLGAMVRHYRARGVYYFQIYNEPNVNDENHQGFANPNLYARVWADEARLIVANGGLPGFGALSPGGAYDHYAFLDRTLRAIKYNGDAGMLNRAWLSVHNYHGTRALDDPDGFLLFRNYDEIIRSHLQRSMPIIGTEGGSYSDDPAVVERLLRYQYNYMKNAEPYFLAFSYWALANMEGGSWDSTWEWQTLFRRNYVHPVVSDFFYKGGN